MEYRIHLSYLPTSRDVLEWGTAEDQVIAVLNELAQRVPELGPVAGIEQAGSRGPALVLTVALDAPDPAEAMRLATAAVEPAFDVLSWNGDFVHGEVELVDDERSPTAAA